jgi:hypothetical protein
MGAKTVPPIKPAKRTRAMPPKGVVIKEASEVRSPESEVHNQNQGCISP